MVCWVQKLLYAKLLEYEICSSLSLFSLQLEYCICSSDVSECGADGHEYSEMMIEMMKYLRNYTTFNHGTIIIVP